MVKLGRQRAIFLASVITLSCALAAGPASPVSAGVSRHPVVEKCPFDPTGGGDRLSRGFYVSDYSGEDIHSVALKYSGSGTFTVTLTARLDRYDGQLLARSTKTFTISDPSTRVRFRFHDVPVPLGSTVTFTQHAVGDGEIFYNVGLGGLGDESYDGCPGVVETEGHRPPLGRFRRASVGLVIRA